MNQKVVRFLCISYVFFTLYNTLIPFSFDFGFADLADRLSRVSLTPYFVDGKRVALTDIVGNIILFIPFGFFFYMLRFYRRENLPIFITTIAGAGLSLTIEFLQLFIQSRDTAIHDLINNTLGSGIGAVVASIYAAKIADVSRKLFYEILDSKPYLLIIVFIAIAQFISAVMPFTVSISVSAVWENIKEANVVPFTYKSVGEFLGYENPKAHYQITEESLRKLALTGVTMDILSQLQSLQDRPGMRKRRFLKTVKSAIGKDAYEAHISSIYRVTQIRNPAYFNLGKFTENILFWIAVGYVMMLCYMLYWQNITIGNLFLWGIPLAYFIFLEGFQTIISSRVTDINDIISGYGGILLGYVLYNIFPPSPNAYLEQSIKMLKTPLTVYIVFVLFSGFHPFDWSLATEVISRDLLPENLVPFYAYFRKTSLWNIYDLANSLAFFIPVSLYLSYSLRQIEKPFLNIYMTTIFLGLLFGVIIETSQLFSYKRIAEITDILAFGGGGAIGTFLVYYFERQVTPALNNIRYGGHPVYNWPQTGQA